MRPQRLLALSIHPSVFLFSTVLVLSYSEAIPYSILINPSLLLFSFLALSYISLFVYLCKSQSLFKSVSLDVYLLHSKSLPFSNKSVSVTLSISLRAYVNMDLYVRESVSLNVYIETESNSLNSCHFVPFSLNQCITDTRSSFPFSMRLLSLKFFPSL